MDSELPSSPRHLPAGTETICLLVSELISILIYLTPRLPTTPMDVPFDRRERSEATINEWQQPVNIIISSIKKHTCPQPKKLLLQTRRSLRTPTSFSHQKSQSSTDRRNSRHGKIRGGGGERATGGLEERRLRLCARAPSSARKPYRPTSSLAHWKCARARVPGVRQGSCARAHRLSRCAYAHHAHALRC